MSRYVSVDYYLRNLPLLGDLAAPWTKKVVMEKPIVVEEADCVDTFFEACDVLLGGAIIIKVGGHV